MNYPLPFLIYFPLFLFFRDIKGATLTMQNKCGYTVWPGILPNAGNPGLGTTGFELLPGGSKSFQVTPGWSGRIWGRTRCSFDPTTGLGTCVTGDCPSGQIECNGSGATPPVTLAEFSLGPGPDTTPDYYDVSLVDGFNIPMIVEPNGGSGSCLITGCASDLNRQCPNELRVGDGDACRSACEAFGIEAYCCSGAYASPSTCSPSLYSQMFKASCPHAYSYAYDDSTSTFTCAGADYTITFCPSLTSQQKASTDTQTPPENSGAQFEIGSGSGSEMQPETGFGSQQPNHHHHKFYIGGGQFISASSPSRKIITRSIYAWNLIILIVISTTFQFRFPQLLTPLLLP